MVLVLTEPKFLQKRQSHTDERGFKGDPDGSWGWALENGATMIQTDRPDELIKYLESKGRRNL